MRPKSKDMKPGTVVRFVGETCTLVGRHEDDDAWWVESEAMGRTWIFDRTIDDAERVDIVSLPDTPAPYPLEDGEVLTTPEEAVRCGWEWRWGPHGDEWFVQVPTDVSLAPVIARPKAPRMVPVLLPEDVVRRRATGVVVGLDDEWDDDRAIDEACRDTVAKLDEEATDVQ